MIMKAKCMVCNETLEWEQVGDASYGIIPIEDQGCVEVTVQDPTGTVTTHMATHDADGSRIERWKQHKRQMNEIFQGLVERGHV